MYDHNDINVLGVMNFTSERLAKLVCVRMCVRGQDIYMPKYRQRQFSRHLETLGKKQFTIFQFHKLKCASAIHRDTLFTL